MGLIAQYDLSAEPDDPEHWGFVKWTYHENPGEKRVRQLDLNKKELSGTLDVPAWKFGKRCTALITAWRVWMCPD